MNPSERPSWADPTKPCGICAKRFVGLPVKDDTGRVIGKVVSAEFVAEGDIVTITTDQRLGLVAWDDEPSHPWWSWGDWFD